MSPSSTDPGAAHVGVFVEEPGPAVHFQGQVGDLHLRQQRLDVGAQGDQRGGLGVGIQGTEHDLVTAVAVFHAQVGIGGIPGGGAPPRRVQGRRELSDDGGRFGLERQVLAEGVALVGPGLRGEQFGAGIAPPGAVRGVDVAAAQAGAELVEHTAGVAGPVDGAGVPVVHVRLPRRRDHLQGNPRCPARGWCGVCRRATRQGRGRPPAPAGLGRWPPAQVPRSAGAGTVESAGRLPPAARGTGLRAGASAPAPCPCSARSRCGRCGTAPPHPPVRDRCRAHPAGSACGRALRRRRHRSRGARRRGVFGPGGWRRVACRRRRR